MSDIVQALGQEFLAAAWETAHAAGCGDDAAPQLEGLLACLEEAEAQLAGLRLQLLHEARLAGVDSVLDRVRVSTRTTVAHAAATLRLATELGDRYGLISQALCEGTISVAQAEAIVAGIRALPVALSQNDLERCQTEVLSYVDVLGPHELRILAARMVELIEPDAAEEAEAARLAREQRRAKNRRSLRIRPDFHGSMHITGQLPVADAALLQAQLDALMPSAASYSTEAELPSVEARRADALVLLAQVAAASGELPAHGLDRPHLHLTVSLQTLTSGLGKAGLFGVAGGEQLSAGEARRLACDANIIPVVLGGPSQPLDVGRTHRTAPHAIRTALTQRDQGCAFPHCTAPPTACEAHHILPWWAGGDTDLSNLVLLCPRHHRLAEPDPDQSAQSQWQIQIDNASGLPIFLPPRHIDPARKPRQHRRHILASLPESPPPRAESELRPKAPLCPDPIDDPWHPDYIPPHKRNPPPALTY